jgi:hypothetical protein
VPGFPKGKIAWWRSAGYTSRDRIGRRSARPDGSLAPGPFLYRMRLIEAIVI